MQVFQALEEYMGVSKNLLMLPHFLKKRLKLHRHTLPHEIKQISGKTENIQQPNSTRSDMVEPSASTNQHPKTASKQRASSGSSARPLNNEDVACVPIVTNGKYMGVIVTEKENSIKDDLSFTDESKSIDTESPSVSSDSVRKVLHEVNTPLNIIKNYIHILGSKLSKHSIAQDEIRIIKEEINRVSHLLSQLQPTSTIKTQKSEPVDINTQITDITRIMKEPLLKRSKVKMIVDIEDDLPAIYANKDTIKQIVVNLLNNSIDAMPDGGELTIKTRYIRQPFTCDGHVFQMPAETLEIIVSDNGVGISPEIKHRIFEPFVSSKKTNHSGVGLSIVRDIVESLNGMITCENNKDKGATFKIYLPLSHSALYHYGIPA